MPTILIYVLVVLIACAYAHPSPWPSSPLDNNERPSRGRRMQYTYQAKAEFAAVYLTYAISSSSDSSDRLMRGEGNNGSSTLDPGSFGVETESGVSDDDDDDDDDDDEETDVSFYGAPYNIFRGHRSGKLEIFERPRDVTSAIVFDGPEAYHCFLYSPRDWETAVGRRGENVVTQDAASDDFVSPAFYPYSNSLTGTYHGVQLMRCYDLYDPATQVSIFLEFEGGFVIHLVPRLVMGVAVYTVSPTFAGFSLFQQYGGNSDDDEDDGSERYTNLTLLRAAIVEAPQPDVECVIEQSPWVYLEMEDGDDDDGDGDASAATRSPYDKNLEGRTVRVGRPLVGRLTDMTAIRCQSRMVYENVFRPLEDLNSDELQDWLEEDGLDETMYSFASI